MATEGSGFNPIPVVVHLVAIALGLWLGYLAMDAIAPNLPDPDQDPGLSSSSAPRAVAGDDPDSLFRAVNLSSALAQLDDQLAAGDGIVSLHIEPGSLDAETGSGDGTFAPAGVPVAVPALLASEINEQRGRAGLGEVSYMDLVATARGPRWYVQLDSGKDIGPPPWTYGAPLEGAPLTVGPAPPKPVG
ncbi:MAG: hypothetical protein QOI10_82 [Solirubrobacterales bacterium]|nr:hypothetical protein [Solirubrobacterales bacterium]